jgi:plastocyanin
MRKQLTVALSLAGVGFAIAALPSTAADPSAEASATKRVEVGDLYFRSRSVSVQRGDTVRWVWAGELPHNVTVTRGPRKFRSRTKSGGTYAKRLSRRGTYRYVCTVHPDSMRARIVVR